MDKIITISLIITAIHVSMLHGMIFYFVREWLELKLPEWLQKPLFSCIICMGGCWTVILFPLLYGYIDFRIIFVALQVIGLNTIISILISKLYD